MRIAILTTGSEPEADQRLIEEGAKRGHEMLIYDALMCYANISSVNPEIYYRGGAQIVDIDAVIPRVDIPHTIYGLSILRQFEAMGVYSLNTATAMARGRDKIRSFQRLAARKIPTPTTAFAHSVEDTEGLIQLVGGPPLIVKLAEGTEGIGVVLSSTHSGASSVINTFRKLDADILVQEFIQESAGTDIRCVVLGDQVIATMERKASEGEFRANIALGATSYQVDITDEERAMAVKASLAMKLDVSGVDIIRSNRGPLIIEINVSPGISGRFGIESTSGVNVAEEMIKYIEREQPRFNPSSRELIELID